MVPDNYRTREKVPYVIGFIIEDNLGAGSGIQVGIPLEIGVDAT